MSRRDGGPETKKGGAALSQGFGTASDQKGHQMTSPTSPSIPEVAGDVQPGEAALMESGRADVDGTRIESELYEEAGGLMLGFASLTTRDGVAEELSAMSPAVMREVAAQLIESANAAEGVPS